MTLEPKEVQGNEEADLREILKILKEDFRKLSGAIDYNTENARKLAVLVNARQKIAMSIFTGTALIRDPKLQLVTDTGKKRDLARMIQKAMLKNNPMANRMVSDVEKKTDLGRTAGEIPDGNDNRK
jgi:hypothetical protein